ncbi:MAG: hypothetical protein ACJ74Z_02130, partial [Bryobacteraceae bacterium]
SLAGAAASRCGQPQPGPLISAPQLTTLLRPGPSPRSTKRRGDGPPAHEKIAHLQRPPFFFPNGVERLPVTGSLSLVNFRANVIVVSP